MSQTEYVYRLTVAVPESLTIPANHLSVAIGEGPGDYYTFGNLTHQDADGNLYSVMSTAATPLLFAYAGNQLQHRSFAPEDWSFELATQAQFAIQLWMGPTEEQPEPPQVAKDKIVGVLGDDPFAAIAAMGLTKLPEEMK